MHTILG